MSGPAVPGTPRVFWVGRKSWEQTPEEYQRRTGEPLSHLADHQEKAVEIAPGVRVAVLGAGNTIAPDGAVVWGARLAVWADDGPGPVPAA